METVITKSGDTVDSICFEYYGFTQGMNELVLEENYGLAAKGAVLAAGIQIKMPPSPNAATTANQTLVQLWD